MADDSSKKYNTVLEIIEKRLIPDQEAKKARGEVFTPLTLVRQMLYGVKKSSVEKGPKPDIWGFDEKTGVFSDDDEKDRLGGIPLEMFRNADTTWLDPANGIGNFPVVAFYMIDYQLGKHGTDPRLKGDKNTAKRRKHIVEKMLYMIELNKGNINTSRKIFKLIAPDAASNICCANTLSMTDAKLQSTFGTNRFDVVMGNPPFNEGSTKHHGDRGFYTRFITYGFSLLKKNGFLVYVHPPNYHRINKNEIKKLFDEYNLVFLRIIPDTKEYFDVQIAIDYYILQNKPSQHNTTILDQHNAVTYGIDVAMFKNVPNFGFGIIKKLEKLKRKEGAFHATIGRDSSNHATRPELYINGTFPIIHLINQDGIRI